MRRTKDATRGKASEMERKSLLRISWVGSSLADVRAGSFERKAGPMTLEMAVVGDPFAVPSIVLLDTASTVRSLECREDLLEEPMAHCNLCVSSNDV